MRGTKRKINFSGFSKCIYLCFLLPLSLHSQYDDWIFHQVNNLTDRHYNYYIFKDSHGFVWISSIAGLNRFDGKTMKTFYAKPGDAYALADNNIHSNFFEDQEANIWFTSNEAIHCYDRDSEHFRKYYLPENDSTQQKEYQALFLDTLKNELWLRNQNELFVWSVKEKKLKIGLGGFEIARTWQVKKQPDGSLIALLPHKKGLLLKFFRHNNQEVPIEYGSREIILGAKPGAVFYENDRSIWLSTDKGFFKANTQGVLQALNDAYHSNKIGQIVKIVPQNKSSLMIATRSNGIYTFNKTWEKFVSQVCISENDRVYPFKFVIDEMYLDPDQTLWIASPDRGVMFTNLKKKKFQTYLQDFTGSSMQSNNIKAITQDQSGRLWCLTDNRVRLLDESGAVMTSYDELLRMQLEFNTGKLFSIFCDNQNQIWIGAQNGLFLYLPFQGSPQKIQLENNNRNLGITHIWQLSDGRILASAQSGGVFEVFNRNNRYFLRSFSSSSIDRAGTYTWIFETRNHQVLFCKYGTGIAIFQKNQQEYKERVFLPLSPIVHGFAEDSVRKKIWIATNMGLYALINRNGQFAIERETLFPEEVIINGILLDKKGVLWCSTNHGILKFDPEKNKGIIRNYTPAEGLQSEVFNFGSYLETRDGRFAFGGINGLNMFDPQAIEDINLSARPQIVEIWINDKAVSEFPCHETGATNISQIKSLLLRYRQNTLSFRFSAMEYSDPAANQFLYKMENYDNSAVFNGKSNFVRYANIPPGRYTLSVQASNSDGIWSENIAQLKIRILPPWYQTWWFISLMVLLFLLVVYGIYRFRVNQVKKREVFLRKEAEYRQKIAESETAVLRLQMKPHFIFNSMNSINNYIRKNDTDAASKYLVRFASLMRRILELAERPHITIAEEMELLEEYMIVEGMRLEKEFSYVFDIEETLDPDEIILPTMILQPFVENAIWHGISYRNGAGRIYIRFQKENEHLVCSVKDNGIGREAAKKMKSAFETRESKAISITARRLELLADETESAGFLKVIDLFEDGKPAGTEVRLQLPIL